MAALVVRNKTATMVGVFGKVENDKNSHAATRGIVCRATAAYRGMGLGAARGLAGFFTRCTRQRHAARTVSTRLCIFVLTRKVLRS